MKELLPLLNNIHPLSPALRNYLSDKLKTEAIVKKEFLLQAGHISRRIYFIKKGLLRSYYIENGQEVCSRFLNEGDIVSAYSFFLRKESNEFIQAIEDSVLYSVGYDELQFMYKHFPECNIIARILISKSWLLSEQRLNFMRMKQAPARYKSMLEFFPELVLRVPAKYMASYLNISVETLSRIRSRKY